MNQSSRFPPLNPLRFSPLKGITASPVAYKIFNEMLDPKYNTYAFDHGMFWQQVNTYYQAQPNYTRKLQSIDVFSVYHDTLAPTSRFMIIDDKGVLAYGPADIPNDYSLAGNTDPDFGDPYNTFDTRLDFNTAGIPSGFYYVIIEDNYYTFGDPGNTFFISEPIHYRDGHGLGKHTWPRTILFEYDNLTNDYDVLFDIYKTGAAPQLLMNFRCEAVIEEIDPASHVVAWEDQNYVVQKANSVPYRLFTLTVYAVAAWVIDKVNRILDCDIVAADGTYYRKDTNATWSFDRTRGSALKTATIILREAVPGSGYTFVTPPIGFDGFRVHTDEYDDTYS